MYKNDDNQVFIGVHYVFYLINRNNFEFALLSLKPVNLMFYKLLTIHYINFRLSYFLGACVSSTSLSIDRSTIAVDLFRVVSVNTYYPPDAPAAFVARSSVILICRVYYWSVLLTTD